MSSRWAIKSVIVVWRDVSSEGAATDLLALGSGEKEAGMGLGEKGLEDVWVLMAQRGWRDYVRVGYVVN
jgi:hypothetical protein